MPRQTDRPLKSAIGPAALTVTGVAIVLFIVSRGYILAVLEPRLSDIRDIYFTKAARAIDLHQTPYSTGFTVEYPPLAWWTICAPRLVDERRIQDPKNGAEVVPVYESYRRAFRGLMFLCDLASFVILLAIVRRRRANLMGWAALTYTLATALLGHLLYDRLDIGLSLLQLCWAYAWIRSCESADQPTSNDCRLAWIAMAYAAIGLGISFKLIPVLAVPFLLLSEVYSKRRFSQLAVAAGALTVSIGLPFAIQLAVSAPAFCRWFNIMPSAALNWNRFTPV